MLSHFSKAERELVEDAMERAADAVALITAGEMDKAMNEYNKKVEK